MGNGSIQIRNITGKGTSFHRLLTRLGIRHNKTAPRNPKANGRAESVVRATKRALETTARDHPRSWIGMLTGVRETLNGTVHKATGFAPVELTLGFMPQRVANLSKVLNSFSLREASKDVLDVANIRSVQPLPDKMREAYRDLVRQRLHTMEGHAHDHMLEAQERTIKQHYNKVMLGSTQKGPKPKPGDPVILLRPQSMGKPPEALGPFYLVEYPADKPGHALLRSGTLSDREAQEWLARSDLLRKYNMRV